MCIESLRDRIKADAERIAELERDFAAIRVAVGSDDIAAFESHYVKPMYEMKRHAEAAEAHDKESEAFLVHQQKRTEAAEADNRELQSALSLRDAQYHAAEARAKAMDFILVEMRGRGWSDKQVNDVVNDYARRIDYALKGEST